MGEKERKNERKDLQSRPTTVDRPRKVQKRLEEGRNQQTTADNRGVAFVPDTLSRRAAVAFSTVAAAVPRRADPFVSDRVQIRPAPWARNRGGGRNLLRRVFGREGICSGTLSSLRGPVDRPGRPAREPLLTCPGSAGSLCKGPACSLPKEGEGTGKAVEVPIVGHAITLPRLQLSMAKASRSSCRLEAIAACDGGNTLSTPTSPGQRASATHWGPFIIHVPSILCMSATDTQSHGCSGSPTRPCLRCFPERQCHAKPCMLRHQVILCRCVVP